MLFRSQRADLVLVIGTPGAWGIHHLVRTILSLSDLGVPSNRILPVVNHAPRQPRSRSQITSAVADLLGSRIVHAEQVPSPVFLPNRRNLESTLRDGDPIPSSITAPLAAAVDVLLSKTEPSRGSDHEGDPIPVAPGSLGTWSDDR